MYTRLVTHRQLSMTLLQLDPQYRLVGSPSKGTIGDDVDGVVDGGVVGSGVRGIVIPPSGGQSSSPSLSTGNVASDDGDAVPPPGSDGSLPPSLLPSNAWMLS